MSPEVVIVGGGPAGLCAAIALAQRSIPTLVCERSTFPCDKACGEGLLPSAVDGLRHFGIARSEVERAGRRIAGIRYLAGSSQAEAEFAGSSGVGLRRTQLSELLFERARSLPSLEIVSGVSAAVRCEPGVRPEVRVGRDRLTPRLILGADGLASRVRRSAGLETVFGRPRRWGIRQHFEMPPYTEHVEVHFAPGIEAYVTPLASSVNVAFLWQPALIAAERGGFPALLRHFPELERRIAGRRALDRPRAAGPLYQTVPRRAKDGILLFGDAAGYIDALTGEGVGLAIAQALALEATLIPRLLENRTDTVVTRAELEPYLTLADAACRSNRQLTRFLLGLTAYPRLVARMIGALREDPRLFQHFLRASSGEVAPLRIPLACAFRLPRSLLRSQSLPSAFTSASSSSLP